MNAQVNSAQYLAVRAFAFFGLTAMSTMVFMLPYFVG